MVERIQFPRTGFVSAGELQRTHYTSDSHHVALIVNGGADPSTHTVLTINPAGEPLEAGEVVIKNYGGREGVVQALVTLGVIEPVRYIEQGFARVPVCKLMVELPEYRR
jgi:hypothetical protein